MTREFSEEARKSALDITRRFRLISNSAYGKPGSVQPDNSSTGWIVDSHIRKILNWSLMYGDHGRRNDVRVYKRTKNLRIKRKVWYRIISEFHEAQGLIFRSFKPSIRSIRKVNRYIRMQKFITSNDTRPYNIVMLDNYLKDIKDAGSYVFDDITIPPKEVDIDEEEA